MKPLAVYVEKLPQVKREFRLLADRVIVHASWVTKGDFEHVVQLDTLKPQYKRLQIRNKLFRYAGWMLAVGLLVFAMMVYQAKDGGSIGIVGWIGASVAGLGVVLMSMTRRNIPFVKFESKDGKGGLDIASAGPDRGNFEAFVAAVQKQIRKQ